MFALEVRINDEEPIIGGTEDLGVVTATVTGVGPLGASSIAPGQRVTPEFHCTLGGLTSRGADAEDEHLHWIRLRQLKVGDMVTIKIVESGSSSQVVETFLKNRDRPNRPG